jgi:hypothetical protein
MPIFIWEYFAVFAIVARLLVKMLELHSEVQSTMRGRIPTSSGFLEFLTTFANDVV